MYQNDDFATGYAVGRDSSNGNNGWGFGNGWEGLIGLALVAGLFGGNWGFGGGFGGGRGGNFCGTPATQADLANGFAQSTLQRGIDDILLQNTNNLNFINQGFAGLNTAIITNGYETRNAVTGGFADLNNAICTLGYQNQAGFNAIGSQLASCCCEISRQISACCCDLKTMNLENRYLNEKQTCEIVSAINAGNQRLVDIYTNDKMEALRAENTALRGQISDERLGDRIINKLSPCPSPAYLVPNPNCCYNPYSFGFGSCGASVQ